MRDTRTGLVPRRLLLGLAALIWSGCGGTADVPEGLDTESPFPAQSAALVSTDRCAPTPAAQAPTLAAHAIDSVVHLASIVTPGKGSSREFEYSVDVLGSQNVLDACVSTGVTQLLVSSSGAAYGYHADNPVPLTEDCAVRGNEEFAYSHHKRLVEEMLAVHVTW